MHLLKHTTICLLIIFCFIDLQAQETLKTDLVENLEWRQLGPWRGGRSCAVTGVPNNDNLFYFGSTGGGIWKTEDGGRSWNNISDGFFGGSVGSIAVSKSDANVIYVGGGEKTVRGNVSYGYGIWKSEDAGKTWHSCGLDKSRHVPRIRIHPTDHNIVYAAVLGDLYKSSDEHVGIVDLSIDPNNYRIMYASSWNVRRTPNSLSSGGEGSGLWKSTDGGETWNDISSKKGLPQGLWGISGIAISPVKNGRVWTIIENKNGGVFRSDDFGETWTKTNSDRSLRQRAWYYSRIYADTKQEDVVYVVNVSYHKSKDGGKTFKSKRAPHGDHHDLWIDPNNSNRMIIGDDGGAQVTYDGGQTWSTYHNQPTAQFYRVTTDNAFPYRIYVAQQDNSTIRIPHRTDSWSITDKHWERTAGGESAHLAPDPKDPEIVYGGSYGGFLTRKDHHTGFTRAINVWPDNPMGHGAEGMKYRFQWNFPLFFSRHDSSKLYTCSNHLHASTDEGHSWNVLSPDLTRNDTAKLKPSGGPITKDNTGVEYYCTIFAADESPIREGLIWTGSDDGLVHLTQDGGQNWKDVTPKGLPEWIQINDLIADPYNEGGCFIAATMYKHGDYQPYLYKTKNYGKSWNRIDNGIDRSHFTRAIEVDPIEKGMLYCGTESGFYISSDNGLNWDQLQLNLPIVPITDIALKDNNVILSTQGRGIWMIDDLSVLHQARSLDGSAYLFKPKDVYRLPGGYNSKVKHAGINHPNGLLAYYYLPEEVLDDTIQIVVTDHGGDTIRIFTNKTNVRKDSLSMKVGLNSIIWNLEYEAAEKFDKMIMWWGTLNGPRALPGDYFIELKIGETIQKQSFTVLADPRSETTSEERQQQFDFLMEVNEIVSEAHETIGEIKKLTSQIQSYMNKGKNHEDIVSQAEKIDSILSKVESTLYQTKNRSGQDPLNFPIRLTNKLAHLNSLMRMGDYPPTRSAMQVKEELKELIEAEMTKFEIIKSEDIPRLNQLIHEHKVDVIRLE
jgi:photosystem II stability/assembly factor-like uncharacterized protein